MTKREEGKRLIDYILMKRRVARPTIDGKLDGKGQELFEEKTMGTNYIIFRPTREKYPPKKSKSNRCSV